MHEGIDLSLNVFQDFAVNLKIVGTGSWPGFRIRKGLPTFVILVVQLVPQPHSVGCSRDT